MKRQKYSVVAGIILFVLAALFSISLLLVAFDFGGINPAKDSFFYSLGKMFTGVYGLTSACIPVFLIIAGIQCFNVKWRLRNGVILLGSIIPFFTLDAIEHICRMLVASESESVLFVKFGSTLLIGALILAAEYLLLSILGDVIENSLSGNADDMEDLGDESDTDSASDEIVIFDDEDIGNQENPSLELKADVPAEKSPEDMENERIFNQQKELLKDLINDGKADANDESTVAEDPTVIEHESFGEEEIVPESVTEDEILDEDDFVEPELPEEPSPFDHIFDEQEKTIESEETTRIHDVALPDFDPEDDNEEPEIDEPEIEETGIQESEIEESEVQDDSEPIIETQEAQVLSSEPELGPIGDEINAEEEDSDDTFDEDLSDDFDVGVQSEPVIEEDSEIQPDDFQNEFDDMTDVQPVVFEIPDSERNSEEDDFSEEPEFGGIQEEIAEDDYSPTLEEGFTEEENLNPTEEIVEEDDTQFEGIDSEEEIDEELTESEVQDDLEDEEPFGVEDIFSQMEADAAANPVLKNQDIPVVSDNSYQQEMDTPDFVSEEELDEAETAQKEVAEGEEKTLRKLSEYKIPTDLLEKFENDEYWRIDDETKQAGENLKQTLNEFGIEAEVTGIRKGPVVTMFELLPAPGVKLSKIVNLQDNIALSLAAKSVRIVAPIPGKHAVGIEIPNKERAIVSFREIIEQPLPEFKKMAIPVILGKDISGQSQIIDIAKTPHLLIAGATGAGKSVCVNSIILSILYNRSPRDVKLIMVDPKVVELKLYNDIPHLLTPVVTEPKKALQVLQYCICEMERRYALLDGMGVRDIVSYNTRIRERKIATEKLPYIVVIIDEFADLMATSGKELETSVARLTAMSRAVGIHLVLATQRPSVNVITGLIKANIPSRIAFMVASRTDSNIIIDAVGAEKLLGKGDMLYTSAVNPIPTRIQGTLVGDNEVERVVDYVKSFGGPDYIDDEIFVDDEEEGDDESGLFSDGEDPLYDQALQIVIQAGKASASYIQRRLKIGYNRAARLVEEMEERGIVGPANGSKPREVIHVP